MPAKKKSARKSVPRRPQRSQPKAIELFDVLAGGGLVVSARVPLATAIQDAVEGANEKQSNAWIYRTGTGFAIAQVFVTEKR